MRLPQGVRSFHNILGVRLFFFFFAAVVLVSYAFFLFLLVILLPIIKSTKWNPATVYLWNALEIYTEANTFCGGGDDKEKQCLLGNLCMYGQWQNPHRNFIICRTNRFHFVFVCLSTKSVFVFPTTTTTTTTIITKNCQTKKEAFH